MSSQVCCKSTQWKICHHFQLSVILWITSLKMHCRHPAQDSLSRWSLQFKTIKNCLIFNQSPFYLFSSLSTRISSVKSQTKMSSLWTPANHCSHFTWPIVITVRIRLIANSDKSWSDELTTKIEIRKWNFPFLKMCRHLCDLCQISPDIIVVYKYVCLLLL